MIKIMEQIDYNGLKVLVMGLGLHGGGAATARFLAERGAEITCTDLRDEAELEPSLKELADLDIHYVLGTHRKKDFDSADMIVKNPAVPTTSPWIAGRKNIETDISLFLKSSSAPLLALTGSKGKSTAVSALYHILKNQYPGTKLGGNITVSPLSFIHDLKPDSPVILELSSWQLADLRGRGILHPRICGITNLMHDHQNRYESFEDYEADKTVILEKLGSEDYSIFPDDSFGERWAGISGGNSLFVKNSVPENKNFRGAYLDDTGRGWFISTGKTDGEKEQLLPEKLMVPGEPFRINSLFASLMARLWGCNSDTILNSISNYSGVPYRMEMFLEFGGIKYYDDTTATIPDACAAAVKAMDRPVILIAGGTDKKLDYAPFDEAAAIPKRIIMLKGSATETWIPRLRSASVEVDGPYDSMEAAVKAAQSFAKPGDAILLSPGATSFGMFQHEFRRGDAFKSSCRKLTEG
ncbi:MAG: UDP-N-acetylmuramoyl-L-alanine--D-glutamate ligase [Spirochaetes bacterium]|nr:MAG: UDP-N-acetylmuramoyl-L-alanine--D-glutamate ligase [Spirochaetota bacterium]